MPHSGTIEAEKVADMGQRKRYGHANQMDNNESDFEDVIVCPVYGKGKFLSCMRRNQEEQSRGVRDANHA